MADLDPRLLGRPPKFGGNDSEWSDWQFQTRAYLDTLDENVAPAITAVELAAAKAKPEKNSW